MTEEKKNDKETVKDESWQSPSKGKGGCLGFIVVILLLVGGGVAALHFTGKLQPLIDRMKGLVSAEKEEKVKEPSPAKPVEDPAEVVKDPVAVPDVEDKPVPEVVVAQPAMSKFEAACRAKFRKPKVGMKLTLSLKTKQQYTGVVEGLDEKGIEIDIGTAAMRLDRVNLSAYSRAKCYEDDYVKYMTGLTKWRADQEKTRLASLEKMKARYAAMLAKRGGGAPASSEGGAKPAAGNVSNNDIDFKKWMDEQGSSDLLEARKKRIEEYEAERRASGREY